MHTNVIERKIMWGDLDALGIVFYPRYYEWIDAGAHLFFESLGLPLSALWSDRGILFGLAETSCRYLRAGRYHETVRIRTHLEDLDAKTFCLQHRVEAADSGALMVSGREKRICMDVSLPGSLRAIEIPADLHARLQAAGS